MDMEETKITFCRLCFTALDKEFSYISNLQEDILQVVIPKLNINSSHSPVICNDCSKVLEKAFTFKSAFLEIEDHLHTYTEGEQKQINLEKVLGISEIENEDNIQQSRKVCRTCLEFLEDGSFIELGRDNCLTEVLQKCLPEMDVELTKNPVLCRNCITILENVSKFITLSQKNEEKVINHLKGTKSEKINIIDIVQLREAQISADMPENKTQEKGNAIDSVVGTSEKIESNKNDVVDIYLTNGEITEGLDKNDVYNTSEEVACAVSTSINNSCNEALGNADGNNKKSSDYESKRKRYNTRQTNPITDLTKKPLWSSDDSLNDDSDFKPSSSDEFSSESDKELAVGRNLRSKRLHANTLKKQPKKPKCLIYCGYCYFKTHSAFIMEKHTHECHSNPYQYIQTFPVPGFLIINPLVTNNTSIMTNIATENKSMPVTYRYAETLALNNTVDETIMPARKSVTVERNGSVSVTDKNSVETVTLNNTIGDTIMLARKSVTVERSGSVSVIDKNSVQTETLNDTIGDTIMPARKSVTVERNGSVSVTDKNSVQTVTSNNTIGDTIIPARKSVTLERNGSVSVIDKNSVQTVTLNNTIGDTLMPARRSVTVGRAASVPVAYKNVQKVALNNTVGDTIMPARKLMMERNRSVPQTCKNVKVVTLKSVIDNCLNSITRNRLTAFLTEKKARTSSDDKESNTTTKQQEVVIDIEKEESVLQNNISQTEPSLVKCDQCGCNIQMTQEVTTIAQHKRVCRINPYAFRLKASTALQGKVLKPSMRKTSGRTVATGSPDKRKLATTKRNKSALNADKAAEITLQGILGNAVAPAKDTQLASLPWRKKNLEASSTLHGITRSTAAPAMTGQLEALLRRTKCTSRQDLSMEHPH